MNPTESTPLPPRYEKFTTFLSLFTSSGTLLCCALPALFVSLGAGATLAGIVGNFPFLITVSEHKGIVFGGAGFLLAVSGVLQWNARNAPCPLDPKLAATCMRARKISLVTYFVSLTLFAIGGTFAFLL